LQELLVLTLAVITMMVVTTFAADLVGRALWLIEYALVTISAVLVFFVMFFVGAEVLMRYAFNSPIPAHLELSELLMPIIVFLAISYTQATHGHVGMDLVLDALPPGGRRYAEMITLLVSIFICSVLAFFSGKNALQLWRFDDVTMTPPYFKTWPSAAAIPIGYALISIRMYVQALHLYDPDRFPSNEPGPAGFHAVE
jgi:TRAP-type C4-dicarboxylate transport system permease small subunit